MDACSELTSKSKADALLHPTRLRVMQGVAMIGRGTAQQIAEAIPDVPPASLYRHLKKLVDANWLEIAGERSVRGALERTYALPVNGAVASQEDLADASSGDHLRYFSSFLASLLGEFGRYLARGEIDLAADRLGYRTMPLYASDEELDRAMAAMREILLPLTNNGPAPNRRAFNFSTLNIPAETPPLRPTPESELKSGR